jgi:hypothetical protein
MRPSKLALFLICSAACDGARTHLDDAAVPRDEDDGGSRSADASSEDAGADASADAFVDWGLLEADEIATPEAVEQIETLECSELELEPCGGELVGTWNVTSFCVTSALDIATQGVQNCPGVLATFERSASGTMRFSADGVHDADLRIDGLQHLVLGDPCMQHLYHEDVSEKACDRYEDQLNGGATKHMAACTFESDACHCDVVIESASEYSSMYEAQGSGIFDGVTLVPFCVEGDSLRIVYGGGVRRTALKLTRAPDGE